MNLTVLGAGAWGTAISLHLVRLGHTVTLMPRRFEFAIDLGAKRENPDYLPGFPFPDSLQIGFELPPVLMETEAILLACPVAGVRDWASRVRDSLGGARRLGCILSLAKGVEPDTFLTPALIVREIVGVPAIAVGTLTGPSRAAEVAEGRPTALVLATARPDALSGALQAALSGSALRV